MTKWKAKQHTSLFDLWNHSSFIPPHWWRDLLPNQGNRINWHTALWTSQFSRAHPMICRPSSVWQTLPSSPTSFTLGRLNSCLTTEQHLSSPWQPPLRGQLLLRSSYNVSLGLSPAHIQTQVTATPAPATLHQEVAKVGMKGRKH